MLGICFSNPDKDDDNHDCIIVKDILIETLHKLVTDMCAGPWHDSDPDELIELERKVIDGQEYFVVWIEELELARDEIEEFIRILSKYGVATNVNVDLTIEKLFKDVE